MRRSRLLLILSLLRSVVCEFSRPCLDVCGNRTEDAVEFRLCVLTCREAMATSREEFTEDIDDDGEEEEGNSAKWLTGDLLKQMARQDDDVEESKSEVAGGVLLDPENDDGGSPFGRGRRGNWRRQREGGGGGGGMGEPERMSFVRIGRGLEDSKKRIASFVRIGRTPAQFFQFPERPYVRIQTSDEDEEDEKDLDGGFYPESEGPGRGNLPSDPVLRVRKSLREEVERGAKRPSSFVRIGKSNSENVDRSDLNDLFVPIGIETEKKAERSLTGIADSPLDGEEERAAGYRVRVGKPSSKRPSFVRIGKSELSERPEKKRPSSFVRIGKSLNEPRKRPSFVRIGKSIADKTPSFEKRPSFVRIGKSLLTEQSPSFEKRPSFVRIGRSFTEKRPSFVRIGKSLPTEKRPSFVRIGRSFTEKRPSFVRIGKSLLDEKRQSFVRIGKSLSQRKRPSFVRIGRSQFPDVGYNNGADIKRSISLAGDNFYGNEQEDKRQSFVRIGKANTLNDATHQEKPASYHQNHGLETINSQRTPSTESVSSRSTTWVPTVLGQVLRQVRSD